MNSQKGKIKDSLLGKTSIEVAELFVQMVILITLGQGFFVAYTNQNGWGAMFVIIPIMFFNYCFEVICSFSNFYVIFMKTEIN